MAKRRKKRSRSSTEGLISAAAGARLLGVHARTARRWIESKYLPGVELGGRYWTTLRAVNELRARAGHAVAYAS